MGNCLLREFLEGNKLITCSDGLFFQKGVHKNSSFEALYASLRKLEGRLYADDIVATLPQINVGHVHSTEWKIRKRSAKRITHYLKKRKIQTLLEVGCGNGWLTHHLHANLKIDCCGIDLNETELRQAVRLFGNQKMLSFLYGDIDSKIFDEACFDAIVLASSIQYFSDPGNLLVHLQQLLLPGGQIHIIDSPFYKIHSIANAKQRSEKYFDELDKLEMALHYFHHNWSVLDGFPYSIMYNPNSVWNQLQVKIGSNSPFPWITIEKT